MAVPALPGAAVPPPWCAAPDGRRRSSDSARSSRSSQVTDRAPSRSPFRTARGSPPARSASRHPLVRQARARLRAVTTPSATVSRPASASANVWPRPIASPTARFRLSAPVHVSTRSPESRESGKGGRVGAECDARRVISARPRGLRARRASWRRVPSHRKTPVATAITFLSAPPSSTPNTVRVGVHAELVRRQYVLHQFDGRQRPWTRLPQPSADGPPPRPRRLGPGAPTTACAPRRFAYHLRH